MTAIGRRTSGTAKVFYILSMVTNTRVTFTRVTCRAKAFVFWASRATGMRANGIMTKKMAMAHTSQPTMAIGMLEDNSRTNYFSTKLKLNQSKI